MAKAPITKTNILKKVHRKSNPVTSLAQLAREFGINTEYSRWSATGKGNVGNAAPRAFRSKVKSLVGVKVYNQIRDNSSVNRLYR